MKEIDWMYARDLPSIAGMKKHIPSMIILHLCTEYDFSVRDTFEYIDGIYGVSVCIPVVQLNCGLPSVAGWPRLCG